MGNHSNQIHISLQLCVTCCLAQREPQMWEDLREPTLARSPPREAVGTHYTLRATSGRARLRQGQPSHPHESGQSKCSATRAITMRKQPCHFPHSAHLGAHTHLLSSMAPSAQMGCRGTGCRKSKVRICWGTERLQHGYSHSGWGSASLLSLKSRAC